MMKYGRYETLRELGRGSMGVVHEAYDPQIDRTLALKVLRQDCYASEASVKRFLREAQTIGKLSHPNIVTVYDAGEDRGAIYIAMELLEGQPLNQVIRKRRFSRDELLELGIQIAETLDYAHSKGVVHRDIKPSNIVAQPNGHIKITDFGIAHIEDPCNTLQTFDGELVGTPAYMSPEQIQCKPVDGRSDIFSLGVILYQLATGMKPFGGEGKTLATLFHEITHFSPREPMDVNSDLDSKLSKVIMQCLCKDPAERFETGRTLAEALRECQQVEQVETLPLLSHSLERKTHALRIPLLIVLAVSALAASVIHFRPEIMRSIAEVLPVSEARTAALTVHTNPFGAAIAIDGTPTGISPLEITLPLGEHRVTATLDGFAQWSHDLTLDAAKNYPLVIQLQPSMKTANTKVRSTPSGTGARIEGRDLSAAPPWTERAAESRSALSSLPRTEDRTEEARLRELRESLLRSATSPPPKAATLRVESTPPGAEILFNGKSVGNAPMELEVDPGEHLIALKHAEYENWERRVRVEEGKLYPFDIDLKRVVQEPVLALESNPPKATVLVNGVDRGKSPLKLKLPPGQHHVKFKLRRYKDWETRVELAEAEEYPLKAKLIPVQDRTRSASPPPPEEPSRSASLSPGRIINELAPHNVWRRIRRLF